ncbi:MAG TPA: 50S ribosomal protein L18 [Candidatus Saccharimonadales bacterium]|nr:50S ribosomal protein L18 [Candidatus Saccharimonadales bacterium]
MKNLDKKFQRQTRIRSKIAVVTDRPRLSVFRSNNYCYAQIINNSGDTIIGLSDKGLSKEKATPIEKAKLLGIEIAKMAKDKKIKEVVFDKGRFSYHGRVKAVAEGAREGGLQF